MKRLGLVVLITMSAHAPAHAATHRVCWTVNLSEVVHCGEPLRKSTADRFVEQANLEFPGNHYWVSTDARPGNWQRARWIGAGAALAAGIYDARTTTQALAEGAVEQNGMYGSHPSAGRLYGTNIAAVAGPFVLMEWLRHRHPEAGTTIDKTGFFSQMVGTAVHVRAGLHNETVITQQRRIQGR